MPYCMSIRWCRGKGFAHGELRGRVEWLDVITITILKRNNNWRLVMGETRRHALSARLVHTLPPASYSLLPRLYDCQLLSFYLSRTSNPSIRVPKFLIPVVLSSPFHQITYHHGIFRRVRLRSMAVRSVFWGQG